MNTEKVLWRKFGHAQIYPINVCKKQKNGAKKRTVYNDNNWFKFDYKMKRLKSSSATNSPKRACT